MDAQRARHNLRAEGDAAVNQVLNADLQRQHARLMVLEAMHSRETELALERDTTRDANKELRLERDAAREELALAQRTIAVLLKEAESRKLMVQSMQRTMQMNKATAKQDIAVLKAALDGIAAESYRDKIRREMAWDDWQKAHNHKTSLAIAVTLNLPWSDKEKANSLGACYDGKTQSWHVKAGTNLKSFVDWL